MYPRETLVKDVKLMDTFFHKYHEESKDGLMRTANVIGGLVKILVQEFPQYSEELLRKFAMCRTMRRMKWVKQQMTAHHEETLRSKRKKSEYAYNQGPKNQTKNTTQTEQNTEKIIVTPNKIQATKNTKKPRKTPTKTTPKKATKTTITAGYILSTFLIFPFYSVFILRLPGQNGIQMISLAQSFICHIFILGLY